MKPIRKCVIYARFSPRPEGAIENCQSIGTQIAACRKYAESQGYEVVSTFTDEQKSRNDMERDGIYRAIKRVCRGQVLVAYSPDRVGAGITAALIDRDLEVKGSWIEYASAESLNGQDPETKLMRSFLAAIAEYERCKIGERTSAGMKFRQENGERMTSIGSLPYGWKLDPKDSSKMVKCPKEQKAIMWMLEQRGLGYSFSDIEHFLNDKVNGPGFEPRGKKWNKTSIVRIVKRATGD